MDEKPYAIFSIQVPDASEALEALAKALEDRSRWIEGWLVALDPQLIDPRRGQAVDWDVRGLTFRGILGMKAASPRAMWIAVLPPSRWMGLENWIFENFRPQKVAGRVARWLEAHFNPDQWAEPLRPVALVDPSETVLLGVEGEWERVMRMGELERWIALGSIRARRRWRPTTWVLRWAGLGTLLSFPILWAAASQILPKGLEIPGWLCGGLLAPLAGLMGAVGLVGAVDLVVDRWIRSRFRAGRSFAEPPRAEEILSAWPPAYGLAFLFGLLVSLGIMGLFQVSPAGSWGWWGWVAGMVGAGIIALGIAVWKLQKAVEG